jgi:hypothetical protein
MRLLAAWQTWKYKSVFDEAYLSQRFESIIHDLIMLDVEQPTLAASALFSAGERRRKWWRLRRRSPDRSAGWVGVCLTVLPLDRNQTAVFLSYLPEDANQARRALRRLLGSQGDRQKYELSRLILNHCQNFALSPEFVDSWSPEKRRIVIGLFSRTVRQKEPNFEHPELSLFT